MSTYEEEWLDDEERQLLDKLKTVKERVEYLLAKYPDARNSDFYLTILYIRHFVPELAQYIKYIPYNIIKKYDGLFESIRRARQKIQEEGRYLPTDPEVLRKRRRLAEKYRRVIPRL
jgi:ribosomal protein S17E